MEFAIYYGIIASISIIIWHYGYRNISIIIIIIPILFESTIIIAIIYNNIPCTVLYSIIALPPALIIGVNQPPTEYKIKQSTYGNTTTEPESRYIFAMNE